MKKKLYKHVQIYIKYRDKMSRKILTNISIYALTVVKGY